MDRRYQNKPFLMLLEGFVLDALGALPEDMDAAAQLISTKVFGDPSWRVQLQAQVGLPKDFGKQLLPLFKENQKIAESKGATLSPQEFAQALVEANFSELIEMAAPDSDD